MFKNILRVVALSLITISGTAKADRIVFSQYDGVNTWINIYVEVDCALAFSKENPGVGYFDRTQDVETQGVEAVEGVDGHWEMRNVYNDDRQVWTKGQNDDKWTRTDNGVQKSSGQLWSRANERRYETVTRTWRTKAVEGVAHNLEVGREATAVVVVPTGVDIHTFIEEMLNK